MNDVETRLRDALAARAEAIRTDPEAYAAVVRRRERRGVRRLVTVGVTGLSVAAVAIAVVVVRPAPAPAPPVTTPAPARGLAQAPDVFVALVDGEARMYRSAEPSTPVRFRPAGSITTAVAAFGDGRRFLTATTNDCRTTFTQWDKTGVLVESGALLTDVEPVPGIEAAGSVPRMAVSPDGAKLAYVLQVRSDDGTCDTSGQLRVRDLSSGAEQVWTAPDDPGTPFRANTLSWSPDGRRLALGQQLPVLDVTQPGGTIKYQPMEEVTVPGNDVCGLDVRVFRGPAGQSAGVVRCSNDPGAEPETSVYVLRDDGRVGQRLFTLPAGAPNGWSVSFDRSGAHAFAWPQSAPRGSRPLYRWDRGHGVHRVDTGGTEFDWIDW
jgi:hypothetical protein